MNEQNELIVERALEALHQKLDFTGKYVPSKTPEKHDGILNFSRKTSRIDFFVEYRREIRAVHFPQILQLHKEQKDHPLMVIAERILPVQKLEFRKEGISYIEANGNAHIDADGQFILIEGAPPVKISAEKSNRAFTKSGLKVVFLLLTNKDFIGANYREIALWADVSLGNVTNVINGLKDLGYVMTLTRKIWKLNNKEQLIQQWMDAYEQRLRPTLEIDSFRFLKQDDFASWPSLPIDTKRTLWGGEPAADLLTRYLRPAILTLYTAETRGELMKHYRIMPDKKGCIQAYRKFWKSYPENSNTVPPLLVYVDLLATGDSRCIETAQIIYEQNIKPGLE